MFGDGGFANTDIDNHKKLYTCIRPNKSLVYVFEVLIAIRDLYPSENPPFRKYYFKLIETFSENKNLECEILKITHLGTTVLLQTRFLNARGKFFLVLNAYFSIFHIFKIKFSEKYFL